METPPADPASTRPPWRPRWPSWGWRAVFESLLIVFSVILALAATEWVEQRRTEARVQEMRGYLIREIRANRAVLADPLYLPHHDRLKSAFGRATGAPGRRMSRAEAEPAIDALFGGGLHQPSLQDAVWSSVSSGDLMEHLPPEEMFMLARVYRAQATMSLMNQQGMENAMGLLDILADEGTVGRQMMRMTLYLEDLTSYERSMIALYDQALAQLGATPTPRDATPPSG
jgi:hypothetical protein